MDFSFVRITDGCDTHYYRGSVAVVNRVGLFFVHEAAGGDCYLHEEAEDYPFPPHEEVPAEDFASFVREREAAYDDFVVDNRLFNPDVEARIYPETGALLLSRFNEDEPHPADRYEDREPQVPGHGELSFVRFVEDEFDGEQAGDFGDFYAGGFGFVTGAKVYTLEQEFDGDTFPLNGQHPPFERIAYEQLLEERAGSVIACNARLLEVLRRAV